jgi:hemerythrin-like domain-containing protein
MNIVEGIFAKVESRLASDTDIRTLLRKDHEEALDLAKRICEATTGEHRKTLLKKLKPALVAHSRAEEAVVYRPLIALKQDEGARGIGLEGFVEHNLLDTLLEKLSASRSPNSEIWAANAKVLHELLQHHIDEEHSTMFGELAKNFDAAQLEAMGKHFVAEKSAVASRNGRPTER